MAFNTGNAVPSTAAKDLSDDAENFAGAVNLLSDTWVDRLGVTRDTVNGRIKKMGFTVPVAYASGIVFSASDNVKTVEEASVVYAPLPSALPFTTTNFAADTAKFIVVQGITSQYFIEKKTIRSITLSVATSELDVIAGTQVRISDRNNGLFEYKTGQTPNTKNIIAASASALDLVLQNNDDGTINLLAAGIIADNATDQKASIETIANSTTGDLTLPSQTLELKLSAAPNIGAKTVRLGKLDQVDPIILEDLKAIIAESGRFGGIPQASQFKKWGLEVTAGVIRKKAIGTDKWEFITTGTGFPGHEAIGWDTSIEYTAGATDLILPFNIPSGQDVISFICAPDETLGASGLTVGASVGVNQVRLQMSFPNRFGKTIEWNGVSAFNIIDIYGSSSIVTATPVSPNELRIAHSRMQAKSIHMTPTGSGIPHLPSIQTNVNAYSFDVKFLDLVAGTLNPSFSSQHNFNLYMESNSIMQLNGQTGGAPNDVGDELLTLGNIFMYGIMRST